LENVDYSKYWYFQVFFDQMKNNSKIWILAGESSGDLYGAELAVALQKNVPTDCSLFLAGMGGTKMKNAGVNLLVDSSELGVVGIIEVISKIHVFFKIFRGLTATAEKEKPDVVVLIDHPEFNIRFAREMWKRNIPVVWYISPQIWAWRKSRIHKLVKYCRKMLVIFPFEVETYAGTSLDVEFTGHPLVDIVRRRKDAKITRDDNLILLLPGSRQSEIKRIMPDMLATALRLHSANPKLKFAVSLNREQIYKNCIDIFEKFKAANKEMPDIEFYCGQTEILLQKASAGLAASGTITVECAIAGLPLVVVYRLNPLTYWIAKMLVSLPYFTMVNIIMEELVFREFLQEAVNDKTLSSALLEILPGGARHNYIERKMREFTKKISPKSSDAADNAARTILKIIS
jgi:lipid-A-disaccharide synthase